MVEAGLEAPPPGDLEKKDMMDLCEEAMMTKPLVCKRFYFLRKVVKAVAQDDPYLNEDTRCEAGD